MESGVSGKGYRMGFPLAELVGTAVRDCDRLHELFRLVLKS